MAAKILIKYSNKDSNVLLFHFDKLNYCYGSKIYVDENQTALIVSDTDKNIVSILNEGNHTLDENLLPIEQYKKTQTLLPYQIYFVNKNNMNIDDLWGSKTPLQINDKKYEDVVLHIKSRGSIKLQLHDFQTVINVLLDRFLSDNIISVKTLQIFINKIVNDFYGDTLKQFIDDNSYSYKDLAVNNKQFLEYFKDELDKAFANYGFKITYFNILNLTINKEDVALLNEKYRQNNEALISQADVNNECEHCGASLNENSQFCPYCRQINPFYIPGLNNNTNDSKSKPKKEMDIIIFIVLILFFWPGAIIYYLYCQDKLN